MRMAKKLKIDFVYVTFECFTQATFSAIIPRSNEGKENFYGLVLEFEFAVE